LRQLEETDKTMVLVAAGELHGKGKRIFTFEDENQ
jgi:hypothetical protein